MNRLSRCAVLCVLALSASCATPGARSGAAVPSQGTLIVNARVIDGTGAPGRVTNVRVIGDRIADIGDLRQRQGETVVVGTGLVLAPGFIDTHSHADGAIFKLRDALADVSQGITTVVVGQDGESPYPLADFFAHEEREPAAVNVASYAGHGTIRGAVLGKDFRRVATPEEVVRMQELVAQEMRAGALGLSTGLEYDPGIYSDPSEVLALAKTAGAMGGRYISHMRSEDRAFWPALQELITIGRENHMPVQVSHIKLAERSLWGEGDSLVRVMERARASGVAITADIYPYAYWHSSLAVLFPKRDFDDHASAAYALSEMTTGPGLIVTEYSPNQSYEGKTLSQIAKLRNSDDTTALSEITAGVEAVRAKGAEASDGIIATSMDEGDIGKLMAWPWSNFCTDGELDGAHPRGFGSFTSILGHYVREEHLLTAEEAIRKATSLAASNVGIRGRGQITVGSYADLVLYDPATVTDRATATQPHLTSTGIRRVWVNGVPVYDGERTTGATPGRVLRRASTGAR